jgi:hypothetical protein
VSLSRTKLKDELAAITPKTTEQDAIDAFALAWSRYFAGAAVAGTSAASGPLDTGIAAMKLAMVGMSASGAGPMKLQLGLVAFWGAIAPLGATMFALTAPAAVVPPLVPPTTLSTLSAALESTFAANAAASLSLADSADALATVLHASAGLGGFASVLVPPGPAAPAPIA